MTYQPKVYRKQGGDEIVVANGGEAIVESGGSLDIESGGAFKLAGTQVTATAAEINQAADKSGRVQTLTANGAITAGIQSVELNNVTTAVTATIASAANHQGFFIAKQVDGGTAGHNITLTAGTWDGSNNVVTLNAQNEAICVYFDSSGDGTIIENVGSVSVS